MLKAVVLFLVTAISISVFSAENKFSFAGHMTLKNDVPEQIQITMFEGDFQQAPDDEDTASMKDALAKQGLVLESEIFYSLKNEKPNMLIMLASTNSESSVLIIDLEKGQKFEYNVSVLEQKRIISRKSGYSDYILEIK